MAIRKVEKIIKTYHDMHEETKEGNETRALTYDQIVRLTPKDNCGRCGCTTCFEYARKVSNKQMDAHACVRLTRVITDAVVDSVEGKVYNSNSKFIGVRPDLNTWQIYNITPQSDCRYCGCKSCAEFADQIISKKISIQRCAYIPTQIKNAISNYLNSKGKISHEATEEPDEIVEKREIEKAFDNVRILLEIMEKKALDQASDADYAILKNGKGEWEKSIQMVKKVLELKKL